MESALGVPIDDIAPNPKRPRLDQAGDENLESNPGNEGQEEEDEQAVSEDELDDWEVEGPVAEDEELEPDGSFLSTAENRIDTEAVNLDQRTHESQRGQKVDIPLSRLRAFIKTAYPDLRISKKSLEELKEFGLSVATEFVSGVIQDKVWTAGDLRYLENTHVKLTKEDGLNFLKQHTDEFPWGIFNCTPGWENVRSTERSLGNISTENASHMGTVAKDQPLITKFFGMGVEK